MNQSHTIYRSCILRTKNMSKALKKFQNDPVKTVVHTRHLSYIHYRAKNMTKFKV